MPSRLGVGFIGAGPVSQAIHLPALVWVPDLFKVARVMDVDPHVADAVARRAGARSTTSVQDLLDDPEVEVVAVCSPHRFHAEQTIAACRSGKKAVLCEKPLTLSVDEAEEVARVSRETGVPVIVGTMHTFDSGWLRAKESWGEVAGTVHTIRSSIVLPPNPRFEDFATEVVTRSDDPEVDLDDPEVRAGIAHLGLMAVGIHNLPHVRTFLPRGARTTILDAEGLLPPFGYRVVAEAGGCTLDLQCLMYQTWRPSWVLEAVGEHRALRMDFTPSYVQAGSARSTVLTGGSQAVHAPSLVNGYVEEWRELARLAQGEVPPPDLSVVVDDLRFAMELADSVADFIRDKAGSR